MLKTVEENQQMIEEIVRYFLKVDNPALLKTGALGTLINILSNIKYDNAMYYHKLIKELNPATLTEFNSLIFQSSIYNTEIQFSKPSINDLNVLIPYQKIDSNNLKIITINKDNKFYSSEGLHYTLEKNIKIFLMDDRIYAKSYNNGLIETLEIDVVENPTKANELLNFVKIPDVKQYKREIFVQTIPLFDFGKNYSFSIPLFDIKELYSLTVFIQRYNEAGIVITSDDLMKYNVDEIKKIYGLKELGVKYTKLQGTQFDKDIYLTFTEDSVSFEVGNGLIGQKLEVGDKIFIDLKTTKGEKGNVNNIDINLSNINVEIKSSSDELLNFYNTNVKVISLNGGIQGQDISDISELRSNLIEQMNTGNSLVTTNDFETFFKIGEHSPFVENKFFNSTNNTYVYNILKDEFNNIIYTNTFNILKDIFKEELFFPTVVYEDISLTSPFYYKEFKNYFVSYIIEPRIVFDIYSELKQSEYEEITTEISVILLYDFNTRKSSIRINNISSDNIYIVSTNQFTMELNILNNFTENINQRFLDEYCLLEEELTDIKIDVLDANNNNIKKTFKCDKSYFQLTEVQKHFYYTRLDQMNHTTEHKYVIGLPYLDTTFFTSSKSQTLIRKLKSFFKITDNIDKIPFNITVNQSFFNTIKLEDSIRKYVVKESSNELLDVKNPVIIEIIADSYQYVSSEYNNISDFKFDLKNEIYKLMKKSEGFETEFYETTVENGLKEKWPMIINIDMMNPKVFKINSSNEIYNKMENDLTSDLDIFQIMDFVPPYFYFDFANIDIDIKLA